MFLEPTNNNKRNSSNKSNIFDAIKPFYYFSKFLGTVPFTITVENSIIDMKTTYNDYLIYVMFNIIHAGLIYMSLIGKLNSIVFETSSEVANCLNQAMILSGIVFAVFLNIINLVMKNYTIEIVRDIWEIDSCMRSLRMEVNHRVHSKIITNYLIFGIFLMMILATVTELIFYKVSGNLNLDMLIMFTLILNYLFIANFLCQFVLPVLSVRERFQKINIGLDDIVNKHYDKDLSEIIRYVSTIHDNLIEIILKINFRFSLWAMILYGSLFVYSTISIFSFIRSIIIYEPRTFYFCLTRTIWFLNYILFLVGVIAAGSSTTRMVIFMFFLIDISHIYTFKRIYQP